MNRGFTNQRGGCGCGRGGRDLPPTTQRGDSCPLTPSSRSGPALAIAYVPSQRFGDLYPMAEALGKGTLFRDLYMPYREGGGRKCTKI